ncbi:MAG: acetyltransferase, partial [uncultured Chthoniobacterales bacterium]
EHPLTQSRTGRPAALLRAPAGRGGGGDGGLHVARPGRLRRALGEDPGQRDGTDQDDRSSVRWLSGFRDGRAHSGQHRELELRRKTRARLLDRPRVLGPRHGDRRALCVPPPGTDAAALRGRRQAQLCLAPRPGKMRLHVRRGRRHAPHPGAHGRGCNLETI